MNRKGRTVWLRFGHEMNGVSPSRTIAEVAEVRTGDWYAWGRKPKGAPSCGMQQLAFTVMPAQSSLPLGSSSPTPFEARRPVYLRAR